MRVQAANRGDHADAGGEPAVFLRLGEVARRLAISTDVIRRMIRRGELPAVCVSLDPRCVKRRYRVSAESLDLFIAARTVHAPPPRRPRRLPYERIV